MLQRSKDPERRAKYAAELAVPPFPEALSYLWRIFARLRARTGSSFGPAPIGFADIDAFVRYSGFRLAPWEVEIVEALDDLRLAEHARTRAAMIEGDDDA